MEDSAARARTIEKTTAEESSTTPPRSFMRRLHYWWSLFLAGALLGTLAPPILVFSWLVKKHDLAPHSYQDVSSWRFADFVFSWDYDFFADGTKARRAGLHEYVDSQAMFMSVFEDFRRRKVIP